MKPVFIDFETFKIEGRPFYPPQPVGVAIKYHGEPARYLAWGHGESNNCTYEEAKVALTEAFKHPDGVAFHNAKFDIDVAETHFGLTLPWQKLHDTLFLTYLDDPHQNQLGLKPTYTRLFGGGTEERDAVQDWLIKNQPLAEEGIKISSGKTSAHYYAGYIAHAPADLVGTYACGDVERTEALFDRLYTSIVDRDMLGAYDRERKLMYVLLEQERQGIPVDFDTLREDVVGYSMILNNVEAYLHDTLGVINLDSNEQLMHKLRSLGYVDDEKLNKTATGKFSTAKGSLDNAINNPTISAVLRYRQQVSTALNTFMKPWLAMAERSGGLIYTTWHQTKVSHDTGGSNGTRTGRLSSTPNFQNIPKDFKPNFSCEAEGLPDVPFANFLPPPRVRNYISHHKGHVLIDRDYSQQEARILAHFDDDELMQTYIDNPWVDFHDLVKGKLEDIGINYPRKVVKGINFGLIYGEGVALLAKQVGIGVDEAKVLKETILSLYKGLGEMYRCMRGRARTNTPIITWGGRKYYCEPPRWVDGKQRTFDYKMVNLLVQGSAADCTKEALIRYRETKHPEARILLTAHDQITVSVPKELIESEMQVLKDAMEGVAFDVVMLSEGSYSTTNWNNLHPFDEKGVKIYKPSCFISN
jgi:DNA polymerase-1